jgi:ABC-type branched-subunit amino acid transport system permease subunit
MFNILTTLVSGVLITLGLSGIDASYLHLASFALGAFTLGGILWSTT